MQRQNSNNKGSTITSQLSQDKQFSNRFQGKTDFTTKDGHYGIVSNAKNPIQKGNQAEMAKAS
jgi:hypothetical protein